MSVQIDGLKLCRSFFSCSECLAFKSLASDNGFIQLLAEIPLDVYF